MSEKYGRKAGTEASRNWRNEKLRDGRRSGKSIKELAEEFGLSYSMTQKITAGVMPEGWRAPTDQNIGANAKREKIARYIFERFAEDGRSPSFREIGDLMGMSSSMVQFHLDWLAKEGVIEYSGSQHGARRIAISGAKMILPEFPAEKFELGRSVK
jgi:hypothetical protein